jgi:hypothetical protein
VKLATQVHYAGDIRVAAREVAAMEAAGLDAVFVPEAYSFDAVSQVGYLAALTERVEIGTGIVNVYSRSAALLGMTAAGCDYATGGRFFLGLGTWPPSQPPSIPAPARHSAGKPQPKLSTSILTPARKAVLRRPVESALAAAVGVEDHARLRVAGGDCVGQRAAGQFRAQVVREGVADDPPGRDVDDRGQVEPAFPGRDVGDVPAPSGVEL